MDADRGGKTVIAGTFAIGRKSLSNAQPISAGETQRTKAEMTMAPSHMPTLHETRANGHLRARSLNTFNTLGRIGPVPLTQSQDPHKATGREKLGADQASDETPARLTSQHFSPYFCFPRRIF
jgi:hypothetical protein